MNLKSEISKSFNNHAADYEAAAKVQNEIGMRLFERLDYLKITPRYILDIGCGPGIFIKLLQKKYPSALIVGVDLAYGMLIQARKKQKWWKKWPLVNADMSSLPFATGSFDLVFANQVIHWADSLPNVISELNRVMNDQGCLMFSTLGPDTFKELKRAWAEVDQYAHTNSFYDMHDIGDALLAERFLDPVVDMETLTAHYSSLDHLLQSLKKQGVRNLNQGRNKGLTSKNITQALACAYQPLCTQDGKYPLSYEVVYGHAWRGQQRRQGQGTETFIPVRKLYENTK